MNVLQARYNARTALPGGQCFLWPGYKFEISVCTFSCYKGATWTKRTAKYTHLVASEIYYIVGEEAKGERELKFI